MHSNYDPFELPQELCAKPQALIGVSGLDTLNNAVHKAVWEMLSSSRRVERAPVLFKLISNAHEFPVIKPKRNSYDWYIPKGILKRNWMNKHLNEIPAVIVIFYDLDWNDLLWNEKMIECASRVQSMRAALEGRNTRITVVLIQDTAPMPAGEDAVSSERAIALCASCELNAKSLFVLPHGDHLQGYIVRLESAFYDLAQNYYHLEVKNIKAHRDHLNKNSHQYLFVRHQFKMGFLNELKQDNHTAHKHYTHAYTNILELRIVDTNAMEIRTVAGFINYKLCKLMFNLNLPCDAISQFRAHIDRFKARVGFQELAFEHQAWLSKQFCVFGDIFDEAVKQGLPAVQTQHPGIYYYQAAQHAIVRKKTCVELCGNVNEFPNPDPLEGLGHLEYFGQRSWRRGKLTGDAPDPQIEASGIQALQYLEKQINHSNVIIALYGLAISQYKTYRCPRTRRHLVLQMADEYYHSQDYGKALTLLTHMLWDFRAERWWGLLSDILIKALKCAYLTASVQDYILITLEVLGNATTVKGTTKKRIYNNLMRILKKQIPEYEPNLPPSSVQSALLLWTQIFKPEPMHFLLDMSNILSCIDCKARFLHNKYEADQNVEVELFIRSTCLQPLSFSRVCVTINTPGYSSDFAVTDINSENPTLGFQSNNVKRFVVDFLPDPEDIGKEIQIGSVNLSVGDSKDCCIDLKFGGVGNDSNSICPELLHFKRCPNNTIDFDNIRPLSTTLIIPRNSKLDIKFEHNNPALVGEWYKIDIIIENKEKFLAEELQLEIGLSEDDINSIELASEIDNNHNKIPLILKLDDLKSNETTKMKFYLRAQKVGERIFNLKISYLLKGNKPIPSIKLDFIHLSVVKPFEITTKFLSSALMEEITKFYAGESFVVMPVISMQSPWPIMIESSHLELNPIIKSLDDIRSQIAGLELQNGETCADFYLVETRRQTDQPLNIGEYVVKWKRTDGFPTTTQLSIIGMTVEWLPLDLKIILPAHGFVRTPLLISYQLYNRSQQLIQLELSMDASEAFMFAGYKQMQMSILPESLKTINYNLYPLIAGSVALPKLTLTVPENSTEGPSLRQEQLKSLVERVLPTHLFVMPQVKGSPKIPDMTKLQKVL